MGKQVKCGSTSTKSGRPCQNPAMIGYSRCQLHRGEWNKPQRKKPKKRR
ncbi:HGGxSTG domain-containing protein [Streptomyces sp. NPDC094472]